MSILEARKLKDTKFLAGGGYYMFPTSWGVYNIEVNQWVTFDTDKYKAPYTPRGGRSACIEVAATCNPNELNYVKSILL